MLGFFLHFVDLLIIHFLLVLFVVACLVNKPKLIFVDIFLFKIIDITPRFLCFVVIILLIVAVFTVIVFVILEIVLSLS